MVKNKLEVVITWCVIGVIFYHLLRLRRHGFLNKPLLFKNSC